MSDTTEKPESNPVPAPLPPAVDAKLREHAEGLGNEALVEEAVDRRLAEIEMIGEEAAVGWKPEEHEPLAPEVRFLHVSRTIHQLVTDRNRSVGIFLAVASILVAAATGLLNVKAEVAPIVPLRVIQYWCLPVTFGTLAVLAVFISFLLIRARIGLIYEVAKLNTLLGLPAKRVERVNPLSIFYIMHLLVVVLGGASAGLTAAMLAYGALTGDPAPVLPPGSPEALNPGEGGPEVAVPLGVGFGIAILYIAGLLTLYYTTILRNTTDAKMSAARS
ncbi:hypothetical protein [Paludisphaera rhizosphaerae]|uniref:hypothetical protein n=1 Tax=Paludisphaera rhizosphaerae TaxID=2711216 RepID=UPI0013EA0855|nr:hypothetical protein [Paludisphaera rhizosphaerae]